MQIYLSSNLRTCIEPVIEKANPKESGMLPNLNSEYFKQSYLTENKQNC